MPNLTVENNDLGSVLIHGESWRENLLTFVGVATVLAGTILARDSVSGKLIPFVKGGVTNENGIPKTVVTYDVGATGAGDISIRALVGGRVRANKLIIDADGDGSNIDEVVLDQLQNYNIAAEDVNELNIPDNQ